MRCGMSSLCRLSSFAFDRIDGFYFGVAVGPSARLMCAMRCGNFARPAVVYRASVLQCLLQYVALDAEVKRVWTWALHRFMGVLGSHSGAGHLVRVSRWPPA